MGGGLIEAEGLLGDLRYVEFAFVCLFVKEKKFYFISCVIENRCNHT